MRLVAVEIIGIDVLKRYLNAGCPFLVLWQTEELKFFLHIPK